MEILCCGNQRAAAVQLEPPWQLHHSRGGRAYWWHPETEERRYHPEHDTTGLTNERRPPASSFITTTDTVTTLQLDDDATVTVIRDFLPDELLEQVLAEGPPAWEAQLESVGTRRSAVYFDELGVTYRFAGRKWVMGASMPHVVARVKEAAAQRAGVAFNGAVVNLYETPSAQIKWHDDGEVSVGPVVASFSLGRAAVMGFRRKQGSSMREADPLTFEVRHNTMVIMGDGVQDRWQHRIFKPEPESWAEAPEAERVRFNLTFHHHQPHSEAAVGKGWI